MQFHLRDLDNKPIPFDKQYAPGALDFSTDQLKQVSPLHAVGQAELANDLIHEVRVHGRFTVAVETACDRCLDPVRVPLDEEFDLLYRPADDASSAEERELVGDESEIGFFEGNSLSLEDVLHECVMLALPMQNVCSEACRGICPDCGQNRNTNPCGCEAKPVDDRWTALRGLQSETGKK